MRPNGKLRVCLDPRPLNEAVKQEHPSAIQEYMFFRNVRSQIYLKVRCQLDIMDD